MRGASLPAVEQRVMWEKNGPYYGWTAVNKSNTHTHTQSDGTPKCNERAPVHTRLPGWMKSAISSWKNREQNPTRLIEMVSKTQNAKYARVSSVLVFGIVQTERVDMVDL